MKKYISCQISLTQILKNGFSTTIATIMTITVGQNLPRTRTLMTMVSRHNIQIITKIDQTRNVIQTQNHSTRNQVHTKVNGAMHHHALLHLATQHDLISKILKIPCRLVRVVYIQVNKAQTWVIKMIHQSTWTWHFITSPLRKRISRKYK